MSSPLTGFDPFHAQRMVAYFNVASTAILIYEHLITWDQEFRSIWTQRWTLSKVLYITMKYSAFVQGGIILFQQAYRNFNPPESERVCLQTFMVTAWLFVMGLGVGEMVLSIRTWAVWKKPRLMGILLAGFWVGAWGAISAILALFLKTVRFDAQLDSPFPGCFISNGDPIFFLSYVILLLYDTVMLVLILIPAYKTYRRGGTSQFVQMVYRDGIVYYACLFALSLLNIIVIVKLPFDYSTVLSQMERNLHAILTARVVLNIHDRACVHDVDDETYVTSISVRSDQLIVLAPMPSGSDRTTTSAPVVLALPTKSSL